MKFLISFLILTSAAFAQEVGGVPTGSDSRTVQPYIESLKEKYQIRPEPSQTYSEPTNETTAEKPISRDPRQVQPYIEQLRAKEGLPPSEEAFTNGGSDDRAYQPYIESLKAGHELKMNIPDQVKNAAGVSVVASNNFDIKSDKVEANTFQQVYDPDSKYAPSVDLFYEYQFYRSRTAGSLGLIGHVNFMTIKGKGVFTKSHVQSSDTVFRFYAIPVTVAASYRLVQTRFVVPYAQLGVTGIPVLETRDDGKASRKGISRGINGILGVALNLDWIARKNAWDQYDTNKVLHTYLTVQLEYLRSISGPVIFNHRGLYAGLMFEF